MCVCGGGVGVCEKEKECVCVCLLAYECVSVGMCVRNVVTTSECK